MNKKITEYHLVVGSESKDLNLRVNEKLSEGFELYGNPFISFNTSSPLLYQPMVKNEYEIEPQSQ